jgi:hypothetical protein
VFAQLTIDADIVDWIVAVMAVAAFVVSLAALKLTSNANRIAQDANNISVGANSLAQNANQLAERTMHLQEDEGRVRLCVISSLMHFVGEDTTPRPMVEVRNISSFPVTITKVGWRQKDGKFLWLIRPEISGPFKALPVRLPSHDSLIAYGRPIDSSDDSFLTVVAVAAITACGEELHGDVEQFVKDFKEHGKKTGEV